MKFQDRQPIYKCCSVHTDWLLFSNFKSWMEKQDWKGKQLDKDILVKGNKIYSENTCLFVTHRVNTLINSMDQNRGKLSIGVTINPENSDLFISRVSLRGKRINLGSFPTENEAHYTYCIEKNKEIISVAEEQKDLQVKEALLNHVYPKNYLDSLTCIKFNV